MFSKSKMIGKFCSAVGGRDCPCCGDAPGDDRKYTRRAVKRSERNKFRREVRKYM